MPPQTHVIVGATRGIGVEFVKQLLSRDNVVIATQRSTSSQLASLKSSAHGEHLTILNCDVSNELSIKSFANEIAKLSEPGGVLEGGVIDTVILNAGINEYPNRISEVSFSSFTHHLQTNTIGPLLTGSLLTSIPTLQIHTLVFISSDSGSTSNFLSHEDGLGAYSATKAALNQGLRHLSHELHRKSTSTSETGGIGKGKRRAPVVLALHPGEVTTDMAANADISWEVPSIGAEESISGMLRVIGEKGRGGVDEGGRKRGGGEVEEGAATFWTWDGRKYPW
ncbi:short-chain dehydrogenase [Halenospora varia]|nr:short-chain dehydrogenase [Halenospora varia]